MSSRRHPDGPKPSSRLSISICRDLIGPGCSLTDEEVATLRDQLYSVAEAITSLMPTPEELESVEERAAIMEFEGGLNAKTAKFAAAILNARGRRR